MINDGQQQTKTHDCTAKLATIPCSAGWRHTCAERTTNTSAPTPRGHNPDESQGVKLQSHHRLRSLNAPGPLFLRNLRTCFDATQLVFALVLVQCSVFLDVFVVNDMCAICSCEKNSSSNIAFGISTTLVSTLFAFVASCLLARLLDPFLFV